eukprot:1932697-Pyramimonas_sp.AAC.1
MRGAICIPAAAGYEAAALGTQVAKRVTSNTPVQRNVCIALTQSMNAAGASRSVVLRRSFSALSAASAQQEHRKGRSQFKVLAQSYTQDARDGPERSTRQSPNRVSRPKPAKVIRDLSIKQVRNRTAACHALRAGCLNSFAFTGNKEYMRASKCYGCGADLQVSIRLRVPVIPAKAYSPAKAYAPRGHILLNV